jgi:hypothetical protein
MPALGFRGEESADLAYLDEALAEPAP